MAVSPDGRLVASADYEGHVAVFSLGQRKLVRAFEGKYVVSIRFADAETLLIGHHPGSVTVLEIENGTTRTFGSTTGAFVFRFAFFADGSRVARTDPNEGVDLWDVGEGRQVFSISERRAGPIGASADGERLYYADDAGTLKMVEADSGDLIHSVELGKGPWGWGLESDPRGRYLFAKHARKLQVLHAPTLRPIFTHEPSEKFGSFAVDSDGNRIALTDGGAVVVMELRPASP